MNKLTFSEVNINNILEARAKYIKTFTCKAKLTCKGRLIMNRVGALE